MTQDLNRALPTGVTIRGPMSPDFEDILSPAALSFVATLHRRFQGRIQTLLRIRQDAQSRYDARRLPKFPTRTAEIRTADWQVAPIPPDLTNRRVEITGPVERKMIINALNSGADVFMADFEDSNAPTWDNIVNGQINLRDAVHKTIRYVAPATGKTYELGPETAVLMVRPRGLHLPERHLEIDGLDASASLVDFGLYFFHNAAQLLKQGSGPYFYLPKLQSYLEARLWNDIFVHSQASLGIASGSIRATVLIETLPAAFQMDEILWELRDHSAGLNCGRWDYIFSYIKTLRAFEQCVLPDRSQVGMTQPNMRAYTQRVIQVCHRRGIHAIGGMAAQIPIKNDPEANAAALQKVREDKIREVTDGHDGTWVAHPGLVSVAREVFDAHLEGPNQIGAPRSDIEITELDLLRVPTGTRTEEGLRHNIRVGVQYLSAWLEGSGCVPLYHLMEDAATAEISRTQVWQWLRHGALLDNGTPVTVELVTRLLREEVDVLSGDLGDAAALFLSLATEKDLTEFLTVPAYEHLVSFT